MKKASLTVHAAMRLKERCHLSLDDVKCLLDSGATVQVSAQRAAQLTHRLFFSSIDDAWFVAVQDINDGGVLTTLPLEYFINLHGKVPAAYRRSARRLATDVAKMRAAAKKDQDGPPAEAVLSHPEVNATGVEQPKPAQTWRLSVCYEAGNSVTHKNLGRTLAAFGNPENWTKDSSIHSWLRSLLTAKNIPVTKIRSMIAYQGKISFTADCLVENLILTESEIAQMRF
jgi:hypothetical protein